MVPNASSRIQTGASSECLLEFDTRSNPHHGWISVVLLHIACIVITKIHYNRILVISTIFSLLLQGFFFTALSKFANLFRFAINQANTENVNSLQIKKFGSSLVKPKSLFTNYVILSRNSETSL